VKLGLELDVRGWCADGLSNLANVDKTYIPSSEAIVSMPPSWLDHEKPIVRIDIALWRFQHHRTYVRQSMLSGAPGPWTNSFDDEEREKKL